MCKLCGGVGCGMSNGQLNSTDVLNIPRQGGLMSRIRHVSLSVMDPKRAAHILALCTGGEAMPFRARHVEGAWICLWNPEENELIEFLPAGYILEPDETGVLFGASEDKTPSRAVHVQLESSVSPEELERIAGEYGCDFLFRERYGGPLYEMWIEKHCLVEFLVL